MTLSGAKAKEKFHLSKSSFPNFLRVHGHPQERRVLPFPFHHVFFQIDKLFLDFQLESGDEKLLSRWDMWCSCTTKTAYDMQNFWVASRRNGSDKEVGAHLVFFELLKEKIRHYNCALYFSGKTPIFLCIPNIFYLVFSFIY